MNKLRDRRNLPNSKRRTAILFASANNTKTAKPRKAYIETLADATDKTNPLIVVPEKVGLVTYELTDTNNGAGQYSITGGPSGSNNPLAIRTGSTRYNFTDYYLLEFIFNWYERRNPNTFLQTDKIQIPAAAFLASNSTSPIGITYRDSNDERLIFPLGSNSSSASAQRVWRNSNTSFGISNYEDIETVRGGDHFSILTTINGYKLTLKTKTNRSVD